MSVARRIARSFEVLRRVSRRICGSMPIKVRFGWKAVIHVGSDFWTGEPRQKRKRRLDGRRLDCKLYHYARVDLGKFGLIGIEHLHRQLH